MNTAYTIVTIAAALWVGFSAYSVLTEASWVVDNLADYGVPRSWWPWLGAAKAAGATGLLIGLAIPAVGAAAAGGRQLGARSSIADRRDGVEPREMADERAAGSLERGQASSVPKCEP